MNTNKPRIGILETGPVMPELTEAHGTYADMFQTWLAPFDADFDIFTVYQGDLPKNPADADLWAITGSRYGAYEDHTWIPPLEDFIRACHDTGNKMIGSCFAHQIIAQALGGKVEKSAKGWGLGVHQYATTKWPGQNPPALITQAYHQDQVVTPPHGANVIASSDFCENAALWYPGFALTVQGHPEINADYVYDLLELRRGVVLTDADVDKALPTVDIPTTSHDLAVYLRDNIAAI